MRDGRYEIGLLENGRGSPPRVTATYMAMMSDQQHSALPEYLTAEQVAGVLQVSAKSVFRWASEDPSMPALRIGRTIRFPRARLLRWFASREQGGGRYTKPFPLSVQPFEKQGNASDKTAPCANSWARTDEKPAQKATP